MRRIGSVILGVVAGLALGVVGSALAARNGSGTYSLPNGPVVAGTLITASAYNATNSDIAAELTNSLDRAGRGAMTAQLPLANGTVGTPALGFGSDTDTGMYSVSANVGGLSGGGVSALTWTSTGVTVPRGLVATQATTNGGGVTATGNGGGSGVSGTGGATNGAGVVGTGGATNGDGVVGVGTGAGRGLNATGGASNGTGVLSLGIGTGYGVFATGGVTSGTGVSGTGGATAGVGVHGAGTGTGAGVTGTGGATNGVGLAGTGTGSGTGVTGASTSGWGGSFTGNATEAPLHLVPQAAPSTPTDGDVWIDTGTGTVKVRIGGSVYQLTMAP